MSIPKYQQGSWIEELFGGLYASNPFDFSYDTEVTFEDVAEDQYDQLYQKYYDEGSSFLGIGKRKRKRKAREKAFADIEELKDDPLYQQSVFRERRMNVLKDYMQSPELQQGIEGLMGQHQDYQKNMRSEKLPIEIAAYTVSPNQGFDLSFQHGGMVEPKISVRGYRNDSPDKDEPALKIMGNKVTMNGVDRPVLLVPDSGDPIYADPNSGDYYFPGATEVIEYPLAGEMPYYQNGGIVEGEFTIAENLPDDEIKRLNSLGYSVEYI